MPDTGSPFTWVPSASSQACTPNCPLPVWNPNASSTAVDIHAVFNASYGLTPDIIMFGEFYNDTIGIGSVTPRSALFSVWLNHQNAKEGTLLFGSVDKSKAHGGLKSAPLTSVVQTPNGNDFTEWSVNLASLTRRAGQAGSEEPLLRTTQNAILDTGSPNMYVPQYLYDALAAPLNVTLCSSPDSLHFTFAGKDGSDGPQIRVLYSEIIYLFGMPANPGEVRSEDGTELCYLGVLSNNGSGIVLLGNTFIGSAYVVYDADDLELRMAQSRWA
ncbi:hypothetical protein PMIN04_010155 [Paraphaeosphaeria minitans]